MDQKPTEIGSRAAAPRVSAANGRRLKILLVEDHPDSAHVLSRLLKMQGYEVQIAGNMATALAAAQQNGFDVILADLDLPDGTGADLMRRLRASGQCLPAIAVSGYGQAKDVQQSLRAGFTAHLIKPVVFDRLNQMILTVTEQSGEGSPC